MSHLPYIIAPQTFADDRGVLHAYDHLPFEIVRVFMVTSVMNRNRGGHAHKKCWQAIWAVGGSFLLSMERDGERQERIVQFGGPGVILPPGWFVVLSAFSDERATAVVGCSEYYDAGDYIQREGTD